MDGGRSHGTMETLMRDNSFRIGSKASVISYGKMVKTTKGNTRIMLRMEEGICCLRTVGATLDNLRMI